MHSPTAQALLVLMRTEIQRYGHSIVGCEELLILVSPTDPIGAQYGHIFLTAHRERWSFEFQNDGTVRFASLDRQSLTIETAIRNPVRKLSAG